MIIPVLLVFILVPLTTPNSFGQDRMDEPYGSRYLNYHVNKLWSQHYGRYSDGGWVSSLYPRYIEDVNNDGMADCVAFGKPGTYVSLSNGSSFVGITKAISNFGTDDAWEVDKHPRFVVDVNGDGYKDLLGYGIQGVYCATYNPSSSTPSFVNFKLWSSQFGSQYNSGFWLNPAFIRTTMDMNNDGKSDLVVFADVGVYVALSNGNGFAQATLWSPQFGTSNTWNNTNYVRKLTDLNGDKLPDIVGYGYNDVYVAINNGSGFNTIAAWTTQFSNTDASGFYTNVNFIRTVGDVNGDGKSDLVVFAKAGVEVAINTGSGFGTKSQWINNYGTDAGWDNTQYLRELADVNGDSRMDVVGFGAAGTYFSMSIGTDFSPAQKWVSDFGYNQYWRPGLYPRYLRDVNGDGVLDLTGYGYYGVYVSESAPLYCCDRTYFYDPQISSYIVNGWMARVHLPDAYNLMVMPKRDPSICSSSPYLNNYRAVGPNSGASQPWLNTSWRTSLGARFAVNANFFDIGHGPQTYQCSRGLGISVSDGSLLSPYTEFNGYETSTLVIYNEATAGTLGYNAKIFPGSGLSLNNVQWAFSGMKLITNGSYVPSQPVPTQERARAAAGLTKDGKTLIFVIQNNGHDGGHPTNESASLEAMANALLKMGAYNAINLDGSGSAQFWFKNNKIEFKSVPSDGSGKYRGVPIAVGVK